MPRQPYRLFSAAEAPRRAALLDERDGIFGLETEHAVLYLPDDGDDARRPTFAEIDATIFRALLGDRKAACSSGLKGGYFLENGGLVHLEIYLRQQSDTPILEVATPECRSPWDLLVYSRAFDSILDSVSRHSRAVLAELGYGGRIAFGKNNLDGHGVGYGSHENYLVRTVCSRRQRIAYLLALPVLLALLLPAIAILILALFVFCVATVAAKVVPPLGAAAVRIFARAKSRGWVERLTVFYYLATNTILFPAVLFYSAVVSRLAFRALTRALTPFLVSRQIFAGSGWLDLEQGVYEIAQRPALTRSLQTIVMFGRRKTIFDLKGLLYEPLSLFRPTKRFTIAVGDSNLSDVPFLARVGATALLIEMVEAGESFDDLAVRRPVAVLREISAGGPWKQVLLRDGTRRSALDLQREYLRRATEFFAGRPSGQLRHDEILALWAELLDGLAERPSALYDRVEWVAKQSLLDRAIRRHSDWKAFLAWGRVFHAAGLEATANAATLDDLRQRVSRRARGRVEELVRALDVDPSDFAIHREIWFQARKIDLKFHELSDGDGYQRTLEREELIERLTDDADIARATREPPPDTRARVRSYYIRLSQSAESILVNWGEVELTSPVRHISLPDPFYHRIPGD